MAAVRKCKSTEEKNIKFLKRTEAGVAEIEIRRDGGFSTLCFASGAMRSAEWRCRGIRLHDHEDEDGKLRRLFCQRHLDMRTCSGALRH